MKNILNFIFKTSGYTSEYLHLAIFFLSLLLGLHVGLVLEALAIICHYIGKIKLN